MKELSSACEDKLPALERHKYEITQPVSSKNTVVVIPYAGKDQFIALQQCLNHYLQYNVLIVEQEGRFNRGALLNAAYLYTTHYFSEVENFVFVDPEAVFNTDFTHRYFGNDGKEMVDFGEKVEAPFGWAVKCTKEVFKKINGFPNNMAKGSSVAFENRLRALRIPVYSPSTMPMLTVKKKVEEECRAAVMVDAIQRETDGVNSLQFTVVETRLGNWTNENAAKGKEANIRTLTLRFVPDVETKDLQTKDSDKNSNKVEDKDKDKDKETKGGAEEEEEEDEEEDDDEPHHLKTMELAYVHPHSYVGGEVVNVLDDEENVQEEKLPFLHSTNEMPTDTINTVKQIKIDF